MRTLVLSFLILALGASPAAAAEISLKIGPREGVVLGDAHRISGVLTDDDGDPLPDQVVTLSVRAWPYEGDYRDIDTGTTGPDGEYRFNPTFDRNQRLRVSAAGAAKAKRAAVFPRAKLSYRTVGRNRVRLIQVLEGPKPVGIRGVTRFYLGRAKAVAARFVKASSPRRREPGRYVARKTVRIPKAYKGRFSYAACFKAGRGSGLGDPAKGCPRRRFRF
ncbi:MAG TPA: hypothetical protein VF533_08560 [Solirubrobacteraceae bacterium]|jgi:hypothetical protein